MNIVSSIIFKTQDYLENSNRLTNTEIACIVVEVIPILSEERFNLCLRKYKGRNQFLEIRGT